MKTEMRENGSENAREADRRKVLSEHYDGVTTVTLDDGKVNAVSLDLITQLHAALDAAQAREDIVILRGRPGIFSAGFDLKYLASSPQAAVELTAAGARLAGRLMRYPEPVIAGCTGHAYPMGAFLLMSSDFVVGVSGDYKLGLNEVAIGLTVPGFAVELARYRLQPPSIRRGVSAGRLFTPEEALAAGMLDAVVDENRLAAALNLKAAEFAAVDRPSFRGTKAKMHAAFLQRFDAVIEAELSA